MMTVATIDDRDPDIEEVFVDIDDSGHFYLKQGDNWIALSLTSKQALLDALEHVHVPR